MASRKILHADCDCFYAAVEMRDDPTLREVPLAVGGSQERRGVIATCNYAARAFGVRSAMPTARALRLCPDLVLRAPDFERYRAVSREILALFHELTPRVEPLSLDEAYLDISAVTRFRGSATWMGEWLKAQCLARTGITLSVGAAPNKFLAKVASDWDKPDGLKVIPPQAMEAFVAALPVTCLPGVGPATATKLETLGIRRCDELRRLPREALIERFGKFGQRLFELCRGRDEREVRPQRERKSVSVETTFPRDLPDLASCQAALPALVDRLEARLARHGHPPPSQAFVKVRFDDFSLTTLEGSAPWDALMTQAWGRGARPVRLLGVGVRLRPPEARRQLPLFDEGP
ncbi:DNA polymerase IV [Halomonas pacifica]|uniref:DNA polymerase IV n=1 Tax=Bisbaumannia pacifica TaxID=77098 RepID=A0ABD4KW53_9GAMM|nr:DNA polymerase IV [Halomonas pacifica]MBH8578627.1 DNA polymerase IV [Halomonas pacifica]MDC8803781.1 DNA polymerase IV [Halomonas pacifica]